MILSAKMCNLCCDYNSTLKIDCPNCHNVFYCSMEHLKEDEINHSKNCIEFKINLETDLHDFHEIEIADIEKYEKKLHEFPKDLHAMIRQLSKHSENVPNICSLAPFSWISTLIYALYKMNSYEHKTEIVVDILGVESESQYFDENYIKLIFHIFKKLKTLKLNFCGPNFQVITDTSRLTYSLEGGRNVELAFEQLVYEKCNSWSTPDVAISFNCGFHEIQSDGYNPWAKAISKMIHHIKVPLIFTSYTFAESKKDLEVVLSIARTYKFTIEIINSNEKNPFRIPYPLKNIYRFLEEPHGAEMVVEPFYYLNNYICILNSAGNDIPTS